MARPACRQCLLDARQKSESCPCYFVALVVPLLLLGVTGYRAVLTARSASADFTEQQCEVTLKKVKERECKMVPTIFEGEKEINCPCTKYVYSVSIRGRSGDIASFTQKGCNKLDATGNTTCWTPKQGVPIGATSTPMFFKYYCEACAKKCRTVEGCAKFSDASEELSSAQGLAWAGFASALVLGIAALVLAVGAAGSRCGKLGWRATCCWRCAAVIASTAALAFLVEAAVSERV